MPILVQYKIVDGFNEYYDYLMHKDDVDVNDDENLIIDLVVLNDLYEQLESHIEIDIQECTEEEVQKIYRTKFLNDYDIIDKRKERDDNE